MLYRSKLRWIRKYVAGRSVLDLGCVCHELDVTDPPWLHGFLCQHAARVRGVDIVSDAVTEMRRRGYDAVCADVETLDLGETFDVVVAGDIIEHLASPGALIERAAAHLAPDGVLLVTTPNPVTLVRLLRVLVDGRVPANKQHTCWFTAKVLRQLAQRYGLEVVDESYTDDTRLYYRLWPALPPGGSRFRRFWRRLALLFRRLLWQPWVLLNSALCLVRPRLSETVCLALARRS